MKTPILLFDESGLVERFETANEAEAALEAIDVRNGVYTAYDASGQRLELSVTPHKRQSWLLGMLFPPQEKVIMEEAKDGGQRKGELAARLRECLRTMGVRETELEEMQLEELIRAVPR